ncbi:testis-expressed protein 2 [Vespa velutina]|uniref:testis-expressed protein 2 n=1 Tax=Vespa velutina TaxID=202808 RepID=UPI001FB42982|nr:testis-expressed protein 2 [Vespa velutina]XP_047348812.1 testis-expressed protein 2 [Vespa velutina]
MMNSKQNTGKITLGMIKGKSFTTSVPIIHYHASDDELEELYLSTDEEKQQDLEYEEVPSQLSLSPSKLPDKKTDKEKMENKLEQRSSSIDGNLSEGTSQSSDPWKVLSDIRGKITKTFEEKIHEIKSEHKKAYRHSKENSSISDSEDLIDVIPIEKSISDKQEKEEGLTLADIKEDSSRFIGFSNIKVGIKTKNSEEDSIESGVEAAELNESFPNGTDDKTQSTPSDTKCIDIKSNDKKLHDIFNQSLLHTILFSPRTEPKPTFAWLKNELLHQLFHRIFVFIMVIACSYYLVPFPEYILGFVGGVLASVTVYDTVASIKRILTTVPENDDISKHKVSVVEIPAVEEHAVLERFEGWLNELPYIYDPQNYHVARTKSVYFRLEGETLRIMETRMRIPKRAVWDEPKHKLKFTRRRTYNLAGAKIELLPEGLIRRRRWSKKYPICITIEKGALIENVALKDCHNKETNTIKHSKKIIEEDTENQLDKKKDKDEDDKQIEQEAEDEIDDEDDGDETDEDSTHTRTLRNSFTDHSENDQNDICKLFIFARADRQKEDWYRRLIIAASCKKRNSIPTMNDNLNQSLSQQTINESKVPTSPSPAFDRPPELNYNAYMTQYLDTVSTTPTTEIDPSLSMYDITWLNCLLGRILFDMHKCSETINLIQDKIQRKLSNIKLPYFMESLLISDMLIGQRAPFIQDTSKPIIDERGLWIDLNVLYKGCLTMTIETKLNLMKLTRAGSMSSNSSDMIAGEKSKTIRSPMFDSDVEDSPETSTEDDDKSSMTMCTTSKDTPSTQSSGKKFLSMVDRLAASKYFQHATELSYVRKAMEGVSNTEIRLTVSVSGIEGCLSLNIPPPPSDRLWYGFKPTPRISITVTPAVGERIVNIGYVTKWIETKLLREFEKIVVLPNMDDLIISLCPNYPYATT